MEPTKPYNPVKLLPWTEGALDTYQKYGYFMFPQQRKIYSNISQRIQTMSTVLEVGCGMGLGTALLSHSLTTKVIGTDNLKENVDVAKNLYPWINFQIWDVCEPPSFLQRVDTVVAVEVLEHVREPILALQHMCSVALKEVWVSTPNGLNKEHPPSNPYHIAEYTVDEIRDMVSRVPGKWNVDLHDWERFIKVYDSTPVDPIVYHLTRS